MVLGCGTFFAIFAGTLQYTGGRLEGIKKQAEEDMFEWKMEMRRNKRRPLEETIAELGEGRGTFCCWISLFSEAILCGS